jgi:hypothetical protein
MGVGSNPLLPHRRFEKHVESKPVAWTHVRPGFYMQNLSGPHRAGIRHRDEVIVPAGNGAANWVDTRDIGELAAVVLAEGGGHHKRMYEPTGPETHCRFDGESPASAAQIDICADFQRGNSAVGLGAESSASHIARSRGRFIKRRSISRWMPIRSLRLRWQGERQIRSGNR